MGFEQLAQLKEQLSKRADANPAAKPAAKDGAVPAAKPTAKPAGKPGKPAGRPGGRPGGNAGSRPANQAKDGNRHNQAKQADQPNPSRGRRPAPAANAKPVDPAVVTIGKLQKRFPLAFPKNPAPKVPLKIGVFEDLVAHGTELQLTEAQLRDALKIWCRGSRYWACLVEGAARVDLLGAEAGRVSTEDGARATRLEASRATRAAAKAAAPAKAASAGKDAAKADGSEKVVAVDPTASAEPAEAAVETVAPAASQDTTAAVEAPVAPDTAAS